VLGAAITEQLTFNFAEPAANSDDDLVAQVRALVAEPGMTDGEIKALMEDALSRMGWRAQDGDLAVAPLAPSCQCSPHGLQLVDEFGDLTCWLCGRRPA
jgi:hypothetical protein